MYPLSQENAEYAPKSHPMNISSRPFYQPATTPARWSTGLCHCCDDPANCLVTCMCPCVTFGQIAEIVNKGSISCAASGTIYGLLLGFTGLSCLYSCFYRSKLRGQYDLEEAPCVDCLVHFFCETCALCQEYRELKNRGFDMGIGWQANIDRQSRGITVAPVIGRGMSRTQATESSTRTRAIPVEGPESSSNKSKRTSKSEKENKIKTRCGALQVHKESHL